jgi:tetrahydromethanopterin S-methyltransferase subunit A
MYGRGSDEENPILVRMADGSRGVCLSAYPGISRTGRNLVMVTFNYERMFHEAAAGLAAISEALEISEEDDTGGADPAIEYIEAMKAQLAEQQSAMRLALDLLQVGDVKSAIDQIEEALSPEDEA